MGLIRPLLDGMRSTECGLSDLAKNAARNSYAHELPAVRVAIECRPPAAVSTQRPGGRRPQTVRYRRLRLVSSIALGSGASPVHVTAMANFDDFNDAGVVVYRVDDPIGTLTNSIPLPAADELLAPRWAWNRLETLDPGNDARTYGARLDRLEFSGGRRLDEYVIACHAAEEP